MEFVYANQDGLVLNKVAGGHVMLHRGDVWFGDDPFVQSRPEMFSETPLTVHSTVGRQSPPATPVGTRYAATVSAAVAAASEDTDAIVARVRRSSRVPRG